jgi:hypothetical protein
MGLGAGVIGMNTAAMAAKAAYGGVAGYQAAKALRNATVPTNFHPRGNLRGTRRKKNILGPMRAAASAAVMKKSSGLIIGKARKSTFDERIKRVLNPPMSFNSKWTFQMDCDSGRVSAIEIPILTQPLLKPIINNIFTNGVSDTAALDPNMAVKDSDASNQYSAMIEHYKSRIKCYNSSTNTLRCRVVWYKPRRDLSADYQNYGPNTHSPINLLMLASNFAQAIQPTLAVGVGSGLVFDASTAGSNYNANYAHGGQTVIGSTTTTTGITNTVALLDPTLVPGSPQVRHFFNHFYKTLKSEEFVLEPGNQFDTSLTMKNKIISNQFDDDDTTYKTSCTVFGVVYVIGQIVTSDGSGLIGATGYISTGSSQVSFMREDTCTMRPIITKRRVRINMTDPYVIIADSEQQIINDETNLREQTYNEDGVAVNT